MSAAMSMAETPLVLIERGPDGPTRGSLALLAVARGLAGTAAAVVVGTASSEVTDTVAAYGADDIYVCVAPGLEADLGQQQVDVLAHLVREAGHRTVLFEHSGLAAEAASGLAVQLDAGVNWDLQRLATDDGELVGTRYALNDSVAVRVGWVGDVRLAVFRIAVNEPAQAAGAGRLHHIVPTVAPWRLAARVVERRGSSTEGVDLATADVIVAGGRGVSDQASLALIEDLADALGGAFAVSMPLVDRGWAPHSRQVGQTGQKVRPRLYVACGISGQLAHRVGMERSGLIVAINADPTAPIFGICDAGVVGDLHQIVPELARRIRAARAAPAGES